MYSPHSQGNIKPTYLRSSNTETLDWTIEIMFHFLAVSVS